MGEPLQRNLFSRRWNKVAVPKQPEFLFQIQLVTMLKWCIRPDVLFWHTPNGELRNPPVARKLKAMGVLAGVADLQFHWCEMEQGRKVRRVLHLELKTGKTKQSDTQVAFALAVKLLGDEYHIVRDVDQAVEILGVRGLIRDGVTVCGKRWGYDARADVEGSFEDAYGAIRERVAAGGPGWVPKLPLKQSR